MKKILFVLIFVVAIIVTNATGIYRLETNDPDIIAEYNLYTIDYLNPFTNTYAFWYVYKTAYDYTLDGEESDSYWDTVAPITIGVEGRIGIYLHLEDGTHVSFEIDEYWGIEREGTFGKYLPLIKQIFAEFIEKHPLLNINSRILDLIK